MLEKARRAITGEAAIFAEHIHQPSEPPDIVFLHNRPWDAPLFRRAFPDARLVLYVHNRVLRLVPRWAKRKALRGFDAVVFISEYVSSDLARRSGYLPVPSVVAVSAPPSEANAIGDDSAIAQPLPVDVLFVGRMTREKGAHVLLRALKSQPGVSARLIGGRWFHALIDLTRYERRVRRLAGHLGERIEVLGPLPPAEVRAHRAVAKIAVVPSVWKEPLGLTVLEGMVSPSAVIATRTGGIPELATRGGVLLVEPGSHTQLAEAIKQLLNDEAALQHLSHAGLDASASMSWVTNYRSIRDLIDHVHVAPAGT
ncbi:MAG: hypothetical protein CMF04_00825 [Hyphomonas sp.]|nr:hypothetical protein [Hyphomonas sp.]